MLFCTAYYNTDTKRSTWEILQMYENVNGSIPQARSRIATQLFKRQRSFQKCQLLLYSRVANSECWNTPKSTCNLQKLARISRCGQFPQAYLHSIMQYHAESPKSNRETCPGMNLPTGVQEHLYNYTAKSYWTSPSVRQTWLAHIPPLLFF